MNGQGCKVLSSLPRTRRLWNKTTHQVQFYLSSLPPDSPKIAAAIRQHWGIENGLHWTLDVTFGEDACRVRSLHAPHNLAVLRHFAVNALWRVAGKQSLRQKSKRAAMDDGNMIAGISSGIARL